MSFLHKIYIAVLTLIVLLAIFFLTQKGYIYYQTTLEERFFNPEHGTLKPSGVLGHGYGIYGSLFMLVGVLTYMLRKRLRSLTRLGLLKHWLEFHIFLCTLGPILVLYHTSFKFGGLVAVSFWSMVAVFASGVIGRFIYIQIPRSIEGRELSLNEVRELKSDLGTLLCESYHLDEESYHLIVDSTQKHPEVYQSNMFLRFFKNRAADRKTVNQVRKVLRKNNLYRKDSRKVIRLVKNDIKLNRRIERLTVMQNLFRYWHVAHLPFAFVMLIIMIIHVGVTLTFGYHWIF
jgi:hypothetical protein